MFPNMKGIFLGLVGFHVSEIVSPNKKATCYSFSYGGFDGISSLLLICFHGRRRVLLVGWWVGWLIDLCVCVGEVTLGAKGERGKGLVVHSMQHFSKAFLLTTNHFAKQETNCALVVHSNKK